MCRFLLRFQQEWNRKYVVKHVENKRFHPLNSLKFTAPNSTLRLVRRSSGSETARWSTVLRPVPHSLLRRALSAPTGFSIGRSRNTWPPTRLVSAYGFPAASIPKVLNALSSCLNASQSAKVHENCAGSFLYAILNP